MSEYIFLNNTVLVCLVYFRYYLWITEEEELAPQFSPTPPTSLFIPYLTLILCFLPGAFPPRVPRPSCQPGGCALRQPHAIHHGTSVCPSPGLSLYSVGPASSFLCHSLRSSWGAVAKSRGSPGLC